MPECLVDDERRLLEEVYRQAQWVGVSLNGYTLRFVTEYLFGKYKGLWD